MTSLCMLNPGNILSSRHVPWFHFCVLLCSVLWGTVQGLTCMFQRDCLGAHSSYVWKNASEAVCSRAFFAWVALTMLFLADIFALAMLFFFFLADIFYFSSTLQIPSVINFWFYYIILQCEPFLVSLIETFCGRI